MLNEFINKMTEKVITVVLQIDSNDRTLITVKFYEKGIVFCGQFFFQIKSQKAI